MSAANSDNFHGMFLHLYKLHIFAYFSTQKHSVYTHCIIYIFVYIFTTMQYSKILAFFQRGYQPMEVPALLHWQFLYVTYVYIYFYLIFYYMHIHILNKCLEKVIRVKFGDYNKYSFQHKPNLFSSVQYMSCLTQVFTQHASILKVLRLNKNTSYTCRLY